MGGERGVPQKAPQESFFQEVTFEMRPEWQKREKAEWEPRGKYSRWSLLQEQKPRSQDEQGPLEERKSVRHGWREVDKGKLVADNDAKQRRPRQVNPQGGQALQSSLQLLPLAVPSLCPAQQARHSCVCYFRMNWMKIKLSLKIQFPKPQF